MAEGLRPDVRRSQVVRSHSSLFAAFELLAHRLLSAVATRGNFYAGIVPGASEEARRVKIMNAN
jgi:hypothetical protein